MFTGEVPVSNRLLTTQEALAPESAAYNLGDTLNQGLARFRVRRVGQAGPDCLSGRKDEQLHLDHDIS